MHRQIKGTPKTAVVKRTPTGKWFVNITVELREKDLQEKPKLPKVATSAKRSARSSRARMNGSPIGARTSSNKKCASWLPVSASSRSKRWLCAIWSRIPNWRSRSPMFFTRLVVKAEEAGRHVVKVDPAYTSRTCSACGHRQPMPLSVRVYECPHCGLVIHRDHNGSLNILADARQAVGRHSRVIPEAPGAGALGSRHFR